MGVYIPGLDMPEYCSECRFGILSGDRYWCAVSLKYRNHEAANYISNDCPLVEIKTPHGRLIDADELMKDICDSLNQMTNIGIAVDGEWLWQKLDDALDNAPTVIEAEGMQ